MLVLVHERAFGTTLHTARAPLAVQWRLNRAQFAGRDWV